MKKIRIEKVVLNIGGIGDELEKGFKLLQLLTERKPAKMKSRKRIPALGVRPNLEVGAVVTIRKGAEDFLKRMLSAIDNTLKEKQISTNNFSFGCLRRLPHPNADVTHHSN